MTPHDPPGLIKTWHELSGQEREAEQAFLAESNRLAAQNTLPRRAFYDAMVARTPLFTEVSLEQVDRDGVRGWWIRPSNVQDGRVILFLHGGGYGLGSAEAYCGLASQLAGRSGLAVFAADYPLAPEHPFPAAYDAGLSALRWISHRDGRQVALAGDSAGGGLALALLADSAFRPAIASVAVFSPWTDLALTGPSFSSPDTRDPIFKPETVTGLAANYLAGADPRDRKASPLYGVPDSLPPLLIQVGTDELLLDDARRYADLAAQKGGEVQLHTYEGLHHVFQRAVPVVPSAGRALDHAAAFLRR